MILINNTRFGIIIKLNGKRFPESKRTPFGEEEEKYIYYYERGESSISRNRHIAGTLYKKTYTASRKLMQNHDIKIK